MALQKPRSPDTLAGAVTKIIETLGDGDIPAGLAAAEQIVDRRASTIREWMDDNKPAEPPTGAAIALDAAYSTRTGGLDGPIWKFYGADLSARTGGCAGSGRYDLMAEMLNAHVVVADMTRTIRDATHPESPGGTGITGCELSRISQAADAMEDAGDRVVIAARQVSGRAG
jgi:hypothetical protein